jgi:transposase
LVAAVSAENGLEAAILFENPINSESFCSILRTVASFGKDFVLFGDNVSYHDSKYTRKKLQNYKTKMIFNIKYTPILNPIERTFL